jgi:small subunit ribosomal protein S1
MTAAKRVFRDSSDDDLDKIDELSDADLDRLMSGSVEEKSQDFDAIEPGTRVKGIVVGMQGDEILVELDGKTVGVVDAKEFDGEEDPPGQGDPIQGEYVQYDADREVHVLSTKSVRTEVAWEELRPGMIVEGIVSSTNKGGLTVDIKGMRAFMPISQIDRQRVEDLDPFVGRKLQCEVTKVEREQQNLVVSRRLILDREYEATRQKAIGKIEAGTTVKGRITRISEHGAFIDVGGADGLLHASRIKDHFGTKDGSHPLKEGQLLEVEIIRVDQERGRIGLAFVAVEENSWGDILGDYSEGDLVSGWISKQTADGLIVSLGEGVEALIPKHLCDKMEDSHVGSIIKGHIASIDVEAKRITVHPQ